MPTKKQLHFMMESDLEFFGSQPVKFGTEPHPRYTPRPLGYVDAKRLAAKKKKKP